jgi:PilZ domain
MVELETRRRAKRFPITTSMLFRTTGDRDWCEGLTVNFSHSGLLFKSDRPLPSTGHAIEFVVALPLNGVMPPPTVHCTGRVVRVVEARRPGEIHAAAVLIDGYAFEGAHHA